MSRHVHKFERLSDEAIFCGCGEIKLASGEKVCALPHWPHVITVPYVRPIQPWYPEPRYPWIVYTQSTGNIQVGTTYVTDGTEQVTLTGGVS